MKQVEGTWDATIRIIVWGVPIATVAIGLLILLFACLQAFVHSHGQGSGRNSLHTVKDDGQRSFELILQCDTGS